MRRGGCRLSRAKTESHRVMLPSERYSVQEIQMVLSLTAPPALEGFDLSVCLKLAIWRYRLGLKKQPRILYGHS